MSKNVSTAMKAHLAQAVTTLCFCWKIVRTDGAVYSFTTLDKDIVVSGVTYRSTAGFSTTTIQSGSTGQVDNLQVLGFLDESNPGGIKYADVKNQLFDFATIYLFLVNWKSVAMGQVNLRRGWLGETVLAPNGAFLAELRGLTQALVQEIGNVYSPMCRNDLGDSNCKIPILPGLWSPNTKHYVGDYVRAATQPDDAHKTAIFQAQNTANSWTSEPAWNLGIGSTTGDGDQAWVSKDPWRRIATVVSPQDQHNFLSTALGMPSGVGGGGTIVIINSLSANSAIEVTDGINTYSFVTPYDLRAGDALYYLYNGLVTSSLHMAYTPLFMASGTAYGIGLANLSGQQGSISKTGDILGAVVIDNFGAVSGIDGGVLSWISGNNSGVSMEIKTYAAGSNQVTLYLGMNMPITAGDKFWYYAGCDKRRDTCVKKFNNISNNRSEPDMPGIDRLLTYPDE